MVASKNELNRPRHIDFVSKCTEMATTISSTMDATLNQNVEGRSQQIVLQQQQEKEQQTNRKLLPARRGLRLNNDAFSRINANCRNLFEIANSG